MIAGRLPDAVVFIGVSRLRTPVPHVPPRLWLLTRPFPEWRSIMPLGKMAGHNSERCEMYSRSEARGICATCEHASDCIYRANSSGTILQCEEFQMPLPRPTDPPVSVRPRPTSNDGKHSTKFLGLCSNCDNRETCTYTKPEGGVWRCEEYV